MKRLLIIALLIACGVWAYQRFYGARPAPGPEVAANAFVKAAMANDVEAIRSLCAEGAAEGALDAAARMRGLFAAVPPGLNFQPSAPTPPAETRLRALVGDRVLALDMAHAGKDWKILKVDLPE